MTKTIALAVLAFLALLGCSGSGGTDKAISDTFSDTQALAEAESAANDVIRNASDCEAVTASFSSVMAKLDEVEGRLQTAVGRTTLGALKKQVGNIGEACGAR
ncbi:MAG TPA: hypothetical protein VJH87_08505 [Vicinamibacteria bacterium]|nr:hypothetical protein [Vicinamibacteria bacterium]